jgi:hypothetical protein
VLELVARAKSRPVASFAVWLLERFYGDDLVGLELDQLRPLLVHPREEVQRFAAARLLQARGLERAGIAVWIELLATAGLEALPAICQAVEKFVRPDRLTLDQCIALARSSAAPVAELGLRWAKEKAKPGDRGKLLALRDAAAPGVRDDAVQWLTKLLRDASDARPEEVRELLDANHADVRTRALAFVGDEPRFDRSPILWAALAESPFPDAQQHLVRKLSTDGDGLAASARRHLWSTTVLAVRTGARAKRQALRQIAARLVEHPEEAAELLPLLRVSLRSVRVAERRPALAAVARAAFDAPQLRAAIAEHMPELVLFDPEAR